MLRPLGWLLGLLLAGLVSGIDFKAPTWVVIFLAVFVGITVVLYLGAFVYCMIHDRDALRSERYSIQKLAIEKGYVGDSSVGLLDNPASQLKLSDVASDEGKRQ